MDKFIFVSARCVYFGSLWDLPQVSSQTTCMETHYWCKSQLHMDITPVSMPLSSHSDHINHNPIIITRAHLGPTWQKKTNQELYVQDWSMQMIAPPSIVLLQHHHHPTVSGIGQLGMLKQHWAEKEEDTLLLSQAMLRERGGIMEYLFPWGVLFVKFPHAPASDPASGERESRIF